MSGYTYDIFLSHDRDVVFGEWLRTHFLPLFRTYVRNDKRRAAQSGAAPDLVRRDDPASR